MIVRMRSRDLGISPDRCQSLIALNSRLEVFGRKVKPIATPYCHNLTPKLRSENVVAHRCNILLASRGPDDDFECIHTVLQEKLCVGPTEEFGRFFSVGAMK